MYDELVKRLRDAAKISEALAVLLPHSEGNATAKLYKDAADAIEELCRAADAIPHVCECCIGCEVESGCGCDRAFVLSPKRAREYLSKPRWIPVAERLPELRQNVLVSDGKGSGEGWLDRYDWHDPNREDVVYTSPQPRDFWCIPGCKVDEDCVIYWMPLPEPPQNE